MKQVWISKAGSPKVLEVREAPDPSPGPGEVRIAVRASGINFADLLARMGTYPDAPPIPCVVGYEVAGVVDGVGPGVDDFVDGDRVLALTRFGGYSTMLCVPRIQVFHMPEAMTFEEGAAIPVNYFTAYLGLFTMGSLQAGQRCLIHSAGGGVGIAATQLAKWAGAEVFGTASAGKHDFLRSAGVDHAIDYRTQEFDTEVLRLTHGDGVHLILDAIGGTTARRGYKILAPLGKIVCYGISSAVKGQRRSFLSLLGTVLRMPRPNAIALMNSNRGILGLNLGRLWSEASSLSDIGDRLVTLYEQGMIKPQIAARFPFEDAPEAHQFLHDRRNIGKVVLVEEAQKNQ